MKRLNGAVLLVLALTLLAFGLRVYHVDAMSVWTDEGLSIYRARSPLLQNLRGEIDIQGVPTTDTHPPLYFLMLSGWSKLTGETEFALRFLSVIAGTLIVPLAYVTGKRLWAREVGMWFAALIATSPFYWWHARDARMYTWLALWALLSVYLIISSLQTVPLTRRRFLLGLLCLAATVLTHYTGVILATALAVATFVVLWRTQRRWAISMLAVLAILAVPALVFALGRLHGAEFPQYRPFQEMLFETWNVFSLGASREQMRPLEFLVIFPALGVVGLIGLAGQRRWGLLSFIGLWLFAPLIAFYLISLIKPAYVNPRNLSIALPAFLLLIAGGLAVLRRFAWPLAAIAFAVVLIEYGAATYQQATDPNLMKDDIRSLVQHIQANYQPGDAVVLHDAIIQLAFDYYARGTLPVTAIPRYGTYANSQQAVRDLQQIVNGSKRLWFVDHPAPVGFSPDLLPTWLKQHTYRLSGTNFYGNNTGAHVNLLQTHTPVVDHLPSAAMALAAHAPEIDFAGSAVPTQAWPADQALPVTTYWQATKRAEPLALVLELIDAQGNVWARREE
ncbi:MAG TPA: glycosyltransferase family 39 protein, partial [Anaerolineae bacterium]|nr:glycosyltransferase family 39 protein [Anaerolineae bacterium]